MQVDRAKVLSNTIKQKRKQKAGKWEVPLPKVRALQQHALPVQRPRRSRVVLPCVPLLPYP